MSWLSVSGISKRLREEVILDDISFSQERFHKTGVIGETGSGKSTLMKIVGGHAQADTGQVLFKGVRVKGIDEQLIPGHKGIAYLSQYFELRNHHRMEELLSYANLLTDEAALEIYKICRIDHLLKRRTDQLSGGEKQRIALARLLVGAPELLLLDEPFSNLDLIHKNTLKSVIHDLSGKLGITCMLVSHDPQDILSWADEILVMKKGRIVQQDRPGIVYHRPVSEYVAGLLGNYNLLAPALAQALFAGVPGMLLNGRQHFIRPEDIRLDTTGSGLEGIVTEVRFHGHYYELSVHIEAHSIQVKTVRQAFQKGDPVSLHIDPAHVWYL